MKVPYFRPAISPTEVDAVTAALRSGWLTSGPRTTEFERAFGAAVGAKHAVAVSSCTAALHLAVEALRLTPGQVVLVPTMTFAATAEVVLHQGAIPVLVDCDPESLNLDLGAADARLAGLDRGRPPRGVRASSRPVGIVVAHVGGHMLDMEAVRQFASRHDLWVVEDAAHAFPAAWRPSAGAPWQRAGEGTANVTGFSFYANKTITTGEGGMAVTESDFLADRMRLMSLHGLSRDAWHRYTGGGWDYRIVAPGFKYNLTDIASALGLAQLARADELRQARERIARAYLEHLAGFDELELPPTSSDRLHAWHLFPIRLHLDRLNLTREAFVEAMKNLGVVCSVHWRPLHLHPYYQDHFGYRPEDCPTASAVFPRLVSLPIFPDMTMAELDHVVKAIASLLARHQRSDVKRTAS